MTAFPPEPAPLAELPDGFHPFWFWNDRVTPEGIHHQVAEMAAQGIRGFFIHSRQGLEQPYLSSQFLDLVEVAFAEARAHGLSVHLYDEYPYPSGAAGGATVQSDPAFAGTRLECAQVELDGGRLRRQLPPGKVLVCTAYPLDGQIDWGHPLDLLPFVGMVLTRDSLHEAGLGLYNDRRYFADTPAPVVEAELPAGRHLLVTAVQVAVTNHKYWGTFPDVTNAAAVQRFLELTHERYRARLGERLGGAASIFVDEVMPTTSSTVLAELRRRHGDNLHSLLEAYAAPGHPRHLAVRREIQEVELRLFEASFEAPLAAWCRDHRVRYSGEKPSLRLSQLAWMDVPGCEPGHTKAGAPRLDLLRPPIRGNARATASAAYFYGKEGSLCECYHSMGWGATLQDAKLIAESLLALGTRWLVPHAFFYSTRGLRKHDAPPDFFHLPHWPLFGLLSRRVERIAHELAGTWIDASVGLVEPSGGLPSPEQLACYELLQHRLLGAHLDYLTVDIDVLAQGEFGTSEVRVRDLALRAIVVPPMLDPESELLAWLARFSEVGGLVVQVGEEDGIDEAVRQLIDRCPPPLDITASSGDPTALMVVGRRGPRVRRWFLLNTAAQPLECTLDAPQGAALRAIALDEGPGPGLTPDAAGSGRTFSLRLEPFESALLDAVPASALPALAGPRPRPRLWLDLSGSYALRPLSPNVARLGTWRFSLPEQGHTAALVEPAPIANQLRRSQLPFAPHITDTFGSSPRMEMPALLARYEADFHQACPTPVRLVMEPGALGGEWQLFLDGAGPYGPKDFSPGPGHVEGCVGLDMPHDPRAPAQRHRLVVEIRATATEHGLRDALYLAGEFGVSAPHAERQSLGDASASGPVEGPGAAAYERVGVPLLCTLVPPSSEGLFGAWEANGLPYFAGVLEHSRELPEHLLGGNTGEGEVVLELGLPEGFEDALEVGFGQGPLRPVPWSPRTLVVPANELAAGPEPLSLRVRVFTTLVRAFEGRYFDPVRHVYRPVEPLFLSGSPAEHGPRRSPR